MYRSGTRCSIETPLFAISAYCVCVTQLTTWLNVGEKINLHYIFFVLFASSTKRKLLCKIKRVFNCLYVISCDVKLYTSRCVCVFGDIATVRYFSSSILHMLNFFFLKHYGIIDRHSHSVQRVMQNVSKENLIE